VLSRGGGGSGRRSGELNDELGGEIESGGSGADRYDAVADFDIGFLDFTGVAGGSLEFNSPDLFGGSFHRQIGCRQIGNSTGDDDSLIWSGFGDDQQTLDGQCALAVDIAHGDNEIADLEIGKRAFFTTRKFDGGIAGNYGSASLIGKIGDGDGGFGFGRNGTDEGPAGHGGFDGVYLIFDGLANGTISGRGSLG